MFGGKSIVGANRLLTGKRARKSISPRTCRLPASSTGLKSLEPAVDGGRVRNAPANIPMSHFQRPSIRLWVIVLWSALGFLAVDTAIRVRHIEKISGLYGVMVDPPAVDASSPTGYSLGRRSEFYPVGGLDALHWVMQTQTMFATDTWRLRHVDYENAPAGREVHWASPYHWWLALLAWGDHVVTGQPIGIAVERAALYANPILLGLVLLTLVPLMARRFGSSAAAFVAAGMVTAFPFFASFVAASTDHHGLTETCALMTVLFLLAGGGGCLQSDGSGGPAEGVRTPGKWLPDRGSARNWFAASAVAGGIGLWISAASQVPALIGVGVGALFAGWMTRHPAQSEGWKLDPTLWRWWGIVGGLTSLAAYLIEYFPSHMGFRLEVNHPLYALAWYGAGELLCRIIRGFGAGRVVFNTRELLAWILPAAALVQLPVVILLTKRDTFFVADRFVWMLSRYVAEGQSLGQFLAQTPFSFAVLAKTLPLLLILAPGLLLAVRRLPPVWNAHLAIAFTPALLFLAMTLAEVRWWGICYGLLLALSALQFALLERSAGVRPGAGLWRLGCALVLLPGAVDAVWSLGHRTGLTPDDIHLLAERDVAQWLRLRMGQDPAVVVSSPSTTTTLIYYGGMKGLGTLYWENREGFEHTAAIFAAPSPDQAHELIRRYGVTHIVLLSWSLFTDDYVRLYLGLLPAQPLPGNAFILRLLHGGGPPPWLRLLPYRLPDNKILNGQTVLVFEVVPDQTPETMVVHTTACLLEAGRQALAELMKPELERFPDSLPALTMLAYLQGESGQVDQFGSTLQQVIGALPQAGTIDLEDRIRLSLVLAVGGRTEMAGAQVRQCMAALDERRLRRLTPDTLRDFLLLAEKLGIGFPDPQLRELAIALVPPAIRGRH